MICILNHELSQKLLPTSPASTAVQYEHKVTYGVRMLVLLFVFPPERPAPDDKEKKSHIISLSSFHILLQNLSQLQGGPMENPFSS